MSHRVNDLPKVWFGCHRRETERIFRKLDALQNMVANELEERVKKERSRKARLEEKLAGLSSVAEMKAQPTSADYSWQLKARLPRSIQAVVRQGQAEIEELEQLLARRRAEHRKQLADIDSQLADYEAVIERLVDQSAAVMDSLRHAEEEGVRLPVTDSIAQVLAAASVEAERIVPVDQDETEVDRGEPSLQPAQLEPIVEQTVHSAKAIELRLRAMLESMESARPHSAVSRSTLARTSLAGASSSWADKVNRSAVQRPSSGTWGDIDLFLTEVQDPELMSYWLDDPALQKKPSSMVELDWSAPAELEEDASLADEAAAQLPVDPAQMRGHMAHAGLQTTIAASASSGSVSSASQAVSAERAAPSVRTAQGSYSEGAIAARTSALGTGDLASPALSEEIRAIQQRYLVGKIAGSTIYAHDGSLITQEGQPITMAAVQAAQRIGKLPELIVHMVMPSLGADGR